MAYRLGYGRFGFIGQPPAMPVEIKKHKLQTKKELPDRLKLRPANPTKNIEEIFYDREKHKPFKAFDVETSTFAPKYRRQVILRELKADIGEILRRLCEQKGVEIIQADACPSHIHMLIGIPPKYSVS